MTAPNGKRKWKILALALAGLLLPLAGWGGYMYVLAGELRALEPHFAGACVRVPGVVGAEDITIHPAGQLAYVSSHNRRAALAGKPGPGAIFGYHLRGARRGQLVNLTEAPSARFYPHGIGLHVEPGQPDQLLVVNHPGSVLLNPRPFNGPTHTIEVFRRAGQRLVLHRTIADAALVSPNDVAPVDRTRFYVTNDHGSGELAGQAAEDFLRLARASVLHFDGRSFTHVAEGLRYANGVAVSRDGRTVYVAATTDRSLISYRRSAADGALTPAGSQFLGTGVDNIELDRSGQLWIGAHPRLLTFVFHAQDRATRAPSEVLKLVPRATGGFAVEQVLLSLGGDLSASSVAARHGDRLLIGGVFDPHLLDCKLPGAAAAR